MPSTQLREKVTSNLATVANGDLGNTETTYYYLPVVDFRYLSLFYTITATTLTVEACNDNESISNADAAWQDISTTILGAANVTATGYKVITTIFPIYRLRIKAVTTNATNALKLAVCTAN